MHEFQTCTQDQLVMNPFTKIGKEWALVSVGNKDQYNTMTVSWGGVGFLWGKNVVYIFIRDSRYSKQFVDRDDTFSLSFLSEDYRDALNYCGNHSGRDGDKFKAAGLTPAFRENIPYPDEASLVFLCKKMAAVRITEDNMLDPEIMKKWYKTHDMHEMYIAEITEAIIRK